VAIYVQVCPLRDRPGDGAEVYSQIRRSQLPSHVADLDDAGPRPRFHRTNVPAQYVRDEDVEGCRSSFDPLAAEYLASL
jgi:hypothetical protein